MSWIIPARSDGVIVSNCSFACGVQFRRGGSNHDIGVFFCFVLVLSFLVGLVVDAEGIVWYTGNGNGTIGRLDPKTGKQTRVGIVRKDGKRTRVTKKSKSELV